MATLQYDFRVVGINSVMAAFRSLERRAMEHNRKVDQMFGGGRGGGGGARSGGMRAGGAGQQADAHVREFKRVRDVRAKNDASVLREETRKNKEWINFKNRLNNERLKAENDHAKKQVDIARRMENDRIKEVKKADKERERIARRSYATARSRAARRYDAGVGALTSLGSAATGAIALGGGAVIASSINSELQLGKSAAMLAGLHKQAGGTGNIKNVQQGITEQARLVGKQTGADRESIIQSMTSFFSASGNVDVAKNLSSFFVDMSQITGASMKDVGELAGNAFFQGMLKNMSPAEAQKATEEIVRTLSGHAALGSINFEDYVKQGKSIMATASRFGGQYAETVGLVSAIAQTTPGGGANSAAEAATSVARFADALPDLSKKGGSFEKMGVRAYTKNQFGTKVLRNPMDVMKDILLATKGGSEEELVKFGFNVRAKRALLGFQSKYRDAGGGEAGMKAVEQHLATFSTARVSPAIQKEVVANLRSTPAMQFEAAMNDLKDQIGQSLLPSLVKVAPAMSRLVIAMEPLINAFAKYVEALVDKPWDTIMDTIKIAIVASIAKQAIGDAIRSAIIQLIATASLAPAALPVAAETAAVIAAETAGATAAGAAAAGGAAAGGATGMGVGTFLALPAMAVGLGALMHLATNKMTGVSTSFTDELMTSMAAAFGGLGAGSLEESYREAQKPPPLTKAQKEEQQQKAAQMLQESAKALQNAAASMGAGGLFGSLFGGLNRGTSPQEPTPSSGSR